MRKVYQPAIDYSQGAVPIDNGGSSAKKQNLAVQYLGLLSQNLVGVPFGAVDLDASGMIKNASFPDVMLSEVINLSGPSSLKVNEVGQYTITDFDSQRTYALAAVAGVVSRVNEVITYTAPDSMGTYGFSLNGKTYGIVIDYYDVVTPNIVSPANEATNQPGAVTLTSNAFAMEGGIDIHVSSDWEISTSGNFDVLLASTMDDAVNKTSWLVSNLTPNTVYFARVRYKANISGYSAWSPIVSFTTSATFAPNAPSVVSPAADAVDVSLALTVTGSAFDAYVTDTHHSSDWQIATDSGFTNIVRSATDDTLNKTSWAVTGLIDLTVYYVRVRYKGTTWGYSEWSAVSQFTTIQANSINTPEIVAPSANALGVSLSPNLSSSAFSVTGGSDSHLSSDWQIATDSGFTTVVKSTTNDTGNKTTWSVTGLLPNTVYYARTRHKGSVLPYSAWSTTVIFNTIAVNAPAINTPTNGSSNLLPNITVTASVFGVTGAADTHQSSDWQFSTTSDFSVITTSFTASTTYKTSITINLSLNTTYYVRVRYRGVTYGISNWSTTISFSTVANYTPNAPVISSPTANATNQGPVIDFTSSTFAMNGGAATHASSDWQIATDAGFTTIVSSATADAVNKTTWSSASLTANTTFYSRVRYLASNGVYSNWSTTVVFTTKAVYIPTTEETILSGITATEYGYFVAMDGTGTRLVIGANNEQNAALSLGTGTGAAYVYVRSGSSWTLERKFSQDTITIKDQYYNTTVNITATSCNGEYFGRCVDITADGTRIIIGAPQYNYCSYLYGNNYTWYEKTGRAVIYVRSGTIWTKEGECIVGYSNAGLGHAVSISDNGDRVICGYPNYRDSTLLVVGGFSYFRRTNSNWSVVTTISPDFNIGSGNVPPYTGHAVAISGDGLRCVIATRTYIHTRIYSLTNTSVTYEQSVSYNGANVATNFAVDLNYDGSLLVFGHSAYAKQYPTKTNAGAIWTAKRTGTSWLLDYNPISPTSLLAEDQFGRSVSLSNDGNMLAVGALYATRNGISYAGCVYIFKWNGSAYVEVAQFKASDAADNSYFGRSVSLTDNGDRLAVSTSNKDKCYIYK